MSAHASTLPFQKITSFLFTVLCCIQRKGIWEFSWTGLRVLWWKCLGSQGATNTFPLASFLLRNLYAGQEATVRTGHETTDWFQIRKEVLQGCILSTYLTYMQNTSWEMLEWMRQELESRLLGEISITSDTHMTTPLWQKEKKTKELLDESERGEWKSWLKTQHSEN